MGTTVLKLLRRRKNENGNERYGSFNGVVVAFGFVICSGASRFSRYAVYYFISILKDLLKRYWLIVCTLDIPSFINHIKICDFYVCFIVLVLDFGLIICSGASRFSGFAFYCFLAFLNNLSGLSQFDMLETWVISWIYFPVVLLIT